MTFIMGQKDAADGSGIATHRPLEQVISMQVTVSGGRALSPDLDGGNGVEGAKDLLQGGT